MVATESFAMSAFNNRGHDEFIQPGTADMVKERNLDQIPSKMTPSLMLDPCHLNGFFLGHAFETWPCTSGLPIPDPIQTPIFNLVSQHTMACPTLVPHLFTMINIVHRINDIQENWLVGETLPQRSLIAV